MWKKAGKILFIGLCIDGEEEEKEEKRTTKFVIGIKFSSFIYLLQFVHEIFLFIFNKYTTISWYLYTHIYKYIYANSPIVINLLLLIFIFHIFLEIIFKIGAKWGDLLLINYLFFVFDYFFL